MMFQREKIYELVCATLSALNEQFMEHGKRVAYLALRFSQGEGVSEHALYRRVFNAFFHDIGAYKTEKGAQENILRFDAVNTYPHALEGYLFLRYFSPLGADAEPLLYHHALWSQAEKFPGEAFREGNLLHLIDRFDALFMRDTPLSLRLKRLKAGEGTIFEPETTERFLSFIKNSDALERLRDRSYLEALKTYMLSIEISDRDLEQYLRMLSFTFEVHSDTTLLHSNMTATLAYELGKYLGLDDERRNRLFIAGLVHDLGKIETPLSILEKPGALTVDEMRVMKNHVVGTRRLIAGYFEPEIVRNAARHHERLNGTGYPDGLTAEELSLSERVMCVADIISALYTKRSYKEAFDTPRVLSILSAMEAKGEIDAAVVRAFTERVPEILEKLDAENAKIVGRYRAAGEDMKRLKGLVIGK